MADQRVAALAELPQVFEQVLAIAGRRELAVVQTGKLLRFVIQGATTYHGICLHEKENDAVQITFATHEILPSVEIDAALQSAIAALNRFLKKQDFFSQEFDGSFAVDSRTRQIEYSIVVPASSALDEYDVEQLLNSCTHLFDSMLHVFGYVMTKNSVPSEYLVTTFYLGDSAFDGNDGKLIPQARH